MVKAFMDSEFTGLKKDSTLISLGIVYDDGHQFYAEFTDYDVNGVTPWIQENVINNLILGNMENNTILFRFGMNTKYVRGTKEFVKQELDFFHQYLYQNKIIEFWSDCYAYDWVLFCDLFGDALSLPKQMYYIPFDIATLMKVKGIDPDINREEFSETKSIDKKHNSLYDAMVIKRCYDKLMSM